MIRTHGITHPGNVRTVNEDAFAHDVDLGVFILADGMGGHSAGEIASTLAVETIRSFIKRTRDDDGFTWPFGVDPRLSYDENRLMTAVKLANRRVFRASESREDYTGMGTTIVVALVEKDQVTFSGVGDSRIYSFYDGRLEQLTRDDSWVRMILDQDPAFDQTLLASHPMRHVLTKVIGARDHAEADVSTRQLRPGETLLMCSDGLHGALDDETIGRILTEEPDLQAIADRLLAEALERDGRDNITALLVQRAE
jgi:protein phosphatase